MDGAAKIFPSQSTMILAKLIHDAEEEPNPLKRRINPLVELQEKKERVTQNLLKYQDNMNALFDKMAKDRIFQRGDLVLRWDSKSEDKGKNGKFYPFQFGPFKVAEAKANKTFLLENLDGEVFELSVNGKYLNHYSQY